LEELAEHLIKKETGGQLKYSGDQ